MVPFAAKFGYKASDEIREEDFDFIAREYARYFGHDPEGNWILVVRTDNTSQIFRFDNIEDMWCCRADREQRLQEIQAATFVPAFSLPDV